MRIRVPITIWHTPGSYSIGIGVKHWLLSISIFSINIWIGYGGKIPEMNVIWCNMLANFEEEKKSLEEAGINQD